MNPKKKFFLLLNECGAVLIRRGKHDIYILPNRRKITVALSPSDRRGWLNHIRDLRHALGVVGLPNEARS